LKNVVVALFNAVAVNGINAFTNQVHALHSKFYELYDSIVWRTDPF